MWLEIWVEETFKKITNAGGKGKWREVKFLYFAQIGKVLTGVDYDKLCVYNVILKTNH